MLIYFDIDGTLIGEKNHIMPESAARAIAAARKNGHVCAVNTGRTGKLLEQDMGRLSGFDAFLMGCGTMITYRDKVILHKTFDEAMSQEIVDALHRFGLDAVLEGAENNYWDINGRIRTKTFGDFMKLFSGMGFGSFEEAPGHFDKFYAYVEDISGMDAFRKQFEGRLEFVDRKGGFFEIMPMGFSKASAMSVLAKELGIPAEDTAALGDSSNDIPMLRAAHIGIAMGNASDDVKAEADFVTDVLEDDGIWKALDWLGVL